MQRQCQLAAWIARRVTPTEEPSKLFSGVAGWAGWLAPCRHQAAEGWGGKDSFSSDIRIGTRTRTRPLALAIRIGTQHAASGSSNMRGYACVCATCLWLAGCGRKSGEIGTHDHDPHPHTPTHPSSCPTPTPYPHAHAWGNPRERLACSVCPE